MLGGRVAVAIAIGFVSAVGAASPSFLLTDPGGDFVGWPVHAARDLVEGVDPYRNRGDATAVPYPLPAAFVGFLFLPLPDLWAGAAFLGLSAALLAFGLTREGQWWRLLLFASYPYVETVRCVQWLPLLLAVTAYPALLPLVLIKPHLGLALLARVRITWIGVIATALVVAASLAIRPDWPAAWYERLGPYRGTAPLAILPLGPLLALALIRWKSRDARYFFLVAALPKRAFYDHLLLWLLPRSLVEMVALTALSWVVSYRMQSVSQFYLWLVAGLYLPVLVALLATPSPRTATAQGRPSASGPDTPGAGCGGSP